MDSLLSIFPLSVTGHHLSPRFNGAPFIEQRVKKEQNNDGVEETSISFSEFEEQIADVIEESNRLVAEGSVTYGSKDDPIMKLFQ